MNLLALLRKKNKPDSPLVKHISKKGVLERDKEILNQIVEARRIRQMDIEQKALNNRWEQIVKLSEKNKQEQDTLNKANTDEVLIRNINPMTGEE